MKPPPTNEQIAIRDSKARVLKVAASAGTGKTSTLVLFAEARPKTKMLYLAFNRPVKEEAQRKFPSNVRCVTTHGLAYPTYGRQYQHKLGNPKAYQIAQLLQVQQREAGAVLNVVTNFLSSADRDINHTHTVGQPIPEMQRDRYVALAKKTWAAMCDVGNNAVVMPHDGYLKLFQLSDPQLNADVILFDESQDSNPVTLAIVEGQDCGKVYVGDSRQSIYGFRGAVNAMDSIKADQTLRLSASFRYGPGVAKLANVVLSAYDNDHFPIEGKGKHATVFAVDRSKPHTVLSRTNGCLFGEAVSALNRGVPFAFVGGVSNYKFDLILDTYQLSANRRDLIKDKMIQSFASFNELVAYGKELDDKEINSMVKLVEEYGEGIPVLIDRITKEAVENLTGDEVLMTTGHRSKGLEFMDVVLTDDFTDMKSTTDTAGRIIPPEREEVNLLYVALTRALRGISVPPSLMEFLRDSDRKLWQQIRADQAKVAEASGADAVEEWRDALITTVADNEVLLTGLGAELQPYDHAKGAFPARIPSSAMSELRKFAADFQIRFLTNEDRVPRAQVDTSKPLYDSNGVQHFLVARNGSEIVTKVGDAFGLWDAGSGAGLKVGSERLRLTNSPAMRQDSDADAALVM